MCPTSAEPTTVRRRCRNALDLEGYPMSDGGDATKTVELYSGRNSLVDAVRAASVMRSATFCGSCSMATWQVGIEIATPPAFFAPASSIAGLSVRSFVAITCHDGFDFQAACVSFSSNIGP